MSATPKSLEHLVERLMTLPGVGRRTAERLAHHLVRTPEAEALSVADAIREARARIRPCSRCHAPAETDPCPICADPARDGALVLVVETARDLEAVESSGAWKGVYHVLGGRVSSVEGVGPDTLSLDALAERVRTGVREVCVATNPDLEGDGTALHVAKALEGTGVPVTRLARGVPAGGSLEFLAKTVLAEAIENRRGAKSLSP